MRTRAQFAEDIVTIAFTIVFVVAISVIGYILGDIE